MYPWAGAAGLKAWRPEGVACRESGASRNRPVLHAANVACVTSL